MKCVIYIYDCVRSRHYGELIRDLQNLESLPAREGFFVRLFVSNKKYGKVPEGNTFGGLPPKEPPRAAERLRSGKRI